MSASSTTAIAIRIRKYPSAKLALVGALSSALRALLLSVTFGGCRSEPSPPDDARARAERMLAGTFSRPGATDALPYRLFVPQGYSDARRYPLIVCLHPSGSNGTDNVRQLTPPVGALIGLAQTIEPAFVLVPQAPEGDKWVSGSSGPPFRNYSQAERPQSQALGLVLSGLDQLEARYAIDSDRIYLTGASSGAAGTWDLVTRNGVGRFAAAVPVTGANDPSRASLIATLPVWTFHGADDVVSPVENTREMVTRLRALGSPVKYTELAGVGHDSWDRAYAEPGLFPWLFAQRRATPSP